MCRLTGVTSIATTVCLSPETNWPAGTATSSAPAASQTKQLLGSVCFRRRWRRFFHSYSTFARGSEIVLNTYNYLDLVPKDR